MEEYEGIIYETQGGELAHWGIKGQKWGLRRFQNPDGSLTPEGQKRYNDKVAKLEAKRTKLANKQAAKARKANIKSLKDDIADRKKALKDGDDIDRDDKKTEKLRNKLLKSTDAKELYKHKDILTSQEINERLNRIDLEKRLGDKATGPKKDVADRLDSIVKTGKKISDMYDLTNTSLGKSIKKMLGFEDKDKDPTMDEILADPDKYSADVITRVSKKASGASLIKNLKDKLSSERDNKEKKEYDAFQDRLKKDREADEEAEILKNREADRRRQAAKEDRVEAEINENISKTESSRVRGLLGPSPSEMKINVLMGTSGVNRGNNTPSWFQSMMDSKDTGVEYLDKTINNFNSSETLSLSKISSIDKLRRSGYTVAEIANRFDVSASTISNYSNGKKFIADKFDGPVDDD